VIREAVRQALRTLRAEGWRTALTLFGIVWGTASVVFLMGWGEGLQIMFEDGFTRSGKNMAVVWAGAVGEDFTPAADRRHLWYELDDAAAVRRRARLPDLVAGEAREWASVGFRQRSLSYNVRGIEPQVLGLRGTRIAEGRAIQQADVDLRKRVAVIGAEARRELFGAESALRSRFRINGESFEVVGVLGPVGTQLSYDGSPTDEQVWIPITAHAALWPREWTDAVVADRILFRVPDRQLYDAASAEVRAILAERLRVDPEDEEAIGIFSTIQVLRKLPFDASEGLMFIIGVGTLLIGGIGVLSMMLDALQERRIEIGLRLAVGARRRDVLLQFLVETLTITGVGGAVGIALGVGGCVVLSLLQVPDLIPLPVLRLAVVQLAVGFVVAVGVAAGVVPAWRAARVDPAETLRMD